VYYFSTRSVFSDSGRAFSTSAVSFRIFEEERTPGVPLIVLHDGKKISGHPLRSAAERDLGVNSRSEVEIQN